ncbi:hypothetical protein [Acetobacter persici]|uniref:hypothetical protein n=1 Tax=Acetobacter persici TaxID=1076596 RepID=UPI001F33A29F|nr:hypothetical protein [Acetobacter persici]MCG0998168.1 hypothetical protein [Acetobacter persici]
MTGGTIDGASRQFHPVGSPTRQSEITVKIEIGQPSLPPVTVTDVRQDFMMTYGGTKGESKRLITVNGLKGEQLPDGSIRILTINAYCHERKMARTFKLDSVKELFVPDTGEVVRDLFGWLRQHSAMQA